MLNCRNRQQLGVREHLMLSEHSKFNIRQINSAIAAEAFMNIAG
jgi:hypothetical protein